MSAEVRKPGRPRSDKPKSLQFSIRLTAENLEKVEEIAAVLGTSINHAVTVCIESMEIPAEVVHAAKVLAAARISLTSKSKAIAGSSCPSPHSEEN